MTTGAVGVTGTGAYGLYKATDGIITYLGENEE